MAKYTLTIETNDPLELADITAAIADEQGQALEPITEGLRGHTAAEGAASKEAEAPKSRRGRPPKSEAPKTSAPVVEKTVETAAPVSETHSVSSPSTTASPSEPAGEVDIQEVKASLSAAMDRGCPTDKLQKMMVEEFGGGAISKIDPAKYAELKTRLDGMKP